MLRASGIEAAYGFGVRLPLDKTNRAIARGYPSSLWHTRQWRAKGEILQMITAPQGSQTPFSCKNIGYCPQRAIELKHRSGEDDLWEHNQWHQTECPVRIGSQG